MKYSYLHLGLLALLAVSCTITEVMEEEESAVVSTHEVYHAVIDDSDGDPATRVYADNKLRVLWNADDRITLFERNTHGDEYVFIGKDGDNSGDFEYVSSSSYGTGGDLDKVYAVYPYQKGTRISYDGVISYTLPNVQVYKEGSFGNGANLMVASTDKKLLNFKNAGGYLTVKLYGNNVSVASVYLTANDGTPLAGPCSIDFSSEGIPTLTMASENTVSKVRVSCPEPVTLGTSKTNYTEFWFVLPPVSLSEFTITVTTPDNKVFSQPVSLDVDIERNKVKRMPPLQVVPGESTESISLNGVSSSKKYRVEPDVNSNTFTITIPTETNFSQLELNYDVDGDLYVNDVKIENGTPIDASAKDGVTLKVVGEYAEKHYTLKARNTGLPVVKITTPENYSRETIEGDANHDTWYKKATIRIYDKDGNLVVEDPKLQIRGRGNATWTYNKRPYALKLDEEREVLGMPAHKRWVLLANWKDRTLLRNDAAFWLSRKTVESKKSVGLAYTVRGTFVELEFDGEYRGNYYLCEQIKGDPNRVNIQELKPTDTDMTGGYLLEIDNNLDDEYMFETTIANKRDGFHFVYKFKEPDPEDFEDFSGPFDYMCSYIETLESKMKNAGSSDYKDYFDIDSAIWFMIVNELTGNGDFYNTNSATSGYRGPHSTYMYKDKDGKLFMGPVWDFDYLTFMPSRNTTWAGANQKYYYYNYLYQDSAFKSRMIELWNEMKDEFLDLTDYIDDMAEYIRLSDSFNSEMWWNSPTYGNKDQNQNGELNMNFDQAIASMKSAFQGKWEFMDGNKGLSTLSYQRVY